MTKRSATGRYRDRKDSTHLSQFGELDGKRHDCDRPPYGLMNFDLVIEKLPGGLKRTGYKKSVAERMECLKVEYHGKCGEKKRD